MPVTPIDDFPQFALGCVRRCQPDSNADPQRTGRHAIVEAQDPAVIGLAIDSNFEPAQLNPLDRRSHGDQGGIAAGERGPE